MCAVAAASADVTASVEEALELLSACGCSDPASRTEVLYAHWYVRARPGFSAPPGCPPDLVEMLRTAHAGYGVWEDGWRVEHVGSRGQAIVRRGSHVCLLELSDYAPATRRGLLPRPGDVVSAVSRRDRVEPRDGWWRAAGPAWSWARAPRGTVRLYFAAGISVLPELVGALTGMLANDPSPWMLKCATDPEQYARADAVIAYLGPRALERHAMQIVALVESCSSRELGDTPPLTLPVVRGLAAAVDPGGDESFGVHRCRLVAEGADGGVQGVRARFAADGIRLDRPWAREMDGLLLPWEGG
ncbi:MAG TPA: T3SS effector HopA1 family protein [Rhodanobacter sp.]|jgi:hypothetical protein|nr:T3SS effector HopA1 family protein [Rhodanobacter sp.]